MTGPVAGGVHQIPLKKLSGYPSGHATSVYSESTLITLGHGGGRSEYESDAHIPRAQVVGTASRRRLARWQDRAGREDIRGHLLYR